MSARILIVEDDIVSGEALRAKMGDLGFETLPLVTTGEEAVAMAAEQRPDLVLMDVRLAGEMDGIEAARRLTAAHDTAVIFMTAYSDDEVLSRAKQTTAHGYLIKPVRDRELAVTIEMALGRHVLEVRLREQTSQLDAIFNTVPSVLMVVDEQHRIERANQAATAAGGYADSDLADMGPGDLLACAVAVANEGCGTGAACVTCGICAAMDDAYATGDLCSNAEAVLETVVDGAPQRRHFIMSTAVVQLHDETRVLLALNDVTDEQYAREAVRRAEARFQGLIEGIGEDFVVFSHGTDGIVSYVSPASRALLGKVGPAIVGHPWTEMASWEPEGVSRAFRALSSLTAGAPAAHEDLVCTLPDGTRRSIGVSWYPVLGDDDEVESIEGVLQDVTERNRYQAELGAARDEAESASLAKTRFLANMSHEIRTPLNAIVGYAQLMLRDGGFGSAHTEYLEVICRSSDHLTALIDDLLEMSKIEAGRSELLLSHFNVHQALRDVEALFRARAAATRIALSLRIDEDVPRELHADERKIRQVVINMVGNAVKHTDLGSVEIHVALVEATSTDVRIAVEVVDTGCGIDFAEFTQVFDAFEQAAQGRRRGEGTGLGMPISRAFARLMGGDVTFTSDLGVGSRFRFEFCAAPGEEVENRETRDGGVAVAIAGPEREWRALVVDDRDVDRHIVVRMLERVGFTVRAAASGAEAVAVAAEWRPDVILMDRRMPGADGLETIRDLRARLGEALPVVMVSASVIDQEILEARDSGVRAVVHKPVREELLYEAVARATGVEFVYEAAAERLPAEGPESPPPADAAARIVTLPLESRRALRAAVEGGDLARLATIVAALDHEHAAAGVLVEKLAGAYEFELLLEVL